jgi:hypothetical protein
LFSDNGLNVITLLPITGPSVMFVTTDYFGFKVIIS